MFEKKIRKEMATMIMNDMITEKADEYMSFNADYRIPNVDTIHVDADYSPNGGWQVSAWIGGYEVDDEGNPEIPDEAPYICRECLAPNANGVWVMDPKLIYQLIYDLMKK